jgi:hypothetical protein
VQTTEKKQLIDEFKTQWKTMWRNRIDDKLRAEGIADKDYSLLFIDRGTVIIATRKFKPPDFNEILQQHNFSNTSKIIPPSPSVGGWGKFIRTALNPHNLTRRRRQMSLKPDRHSAQQQLKKGGRGWLHLGR